VEVEQTLVAAARAGVGDAREALASRCRRAAYVLALQITGRPDDALDIAQDAMVRFFEHLDQFDDERAVRPWLFTIVRNRVRDLWRRRAARPAQALDPDLLVSQLIDAGPTPEQAYASTERTRRVWRTVAGLSADHREILVLRDGHDLSYAEIARVLEVPAGTVMSRLHAARKAFARAFTKGGHEA
jgi:RNA polymerase sigma-70 factor (ECF subfamily)